MRNPNGYGGVCKLGGKRRKPFMARVTVGWEVVDGETGKVLATIKSAGELPESLPEQAKLKQVYEPIGYFKTRPEAMIALAEYNKNPINLDAATVTFAEIYEQWSKRKFSRPGISKSLPYTYQAAYKAANSLHNMKFRDIRTSHLEAVIDDCKTKNGVNSLNNIKLLFGQLYHYALRNDIVNKNYADFVEVDVVKTESTRSAFTAKEIDLLWKNVSRIEYVDTILIMIYSGLRPGELLDLETKKINIEDRAMTGGLKTEAGKNRLIPIHKKTLPFIAKRKEEGQEFLLHYENQQMSYQRYYNYIWKPIMNQLKMSHKPHDCRHTFASLMDRAGANKIAVKKIMGHSAKDITEKYTHKDVEDLLQAIDLI